MSSYPASSQERDAWILSRRPARATVDAQLPHAFLIEEERAGLGEVVRVATVFLTNRECPWRCVFCDLWKHTLTESVPPGAIPAQIDYALARLSPTSPQSFAGGVRPSSAAGTPVGQGGFLRPGTGALRGHSTPPSEAKVAAVAKDSGSFHARHIKLYNSGSFFDRAAIPPEDYPAIAAQLRGFERVIVECHPALVNDRVLRFRDLLANGTTLEVAMGLETAHPGVLEKLNKRMTLDDFARAAAFLKQHGIALRVFVLVQPPFLDEAEALPWAQRSFDFAFDHGAGVVSLIPVRGGNGALDALAAQGQFAPPQLATLEAASAYGVGLGRGRVFADLWDLEKFSSCAACLPARRDRLRQMNLTQSVRPSVNCPQCS